MNKLRYISFIIGTNILVLTTKLSVYASGNEAANQLKEILKLLTSFVSKAGWLLVAFGLGKIIMAFMSDDPPGKQRGVTIILGGFFCALIAEILDKVGVTSGFGGLS